jgi:hypothetical protein
MLNRTNLTLSARTLSIRLNLGTRSLAINASVNHGGQTLRTRQTHHDAVREGMVWYDVFPIMPARYGIPTNPGSFSQPQQCLPSCALAQPGGSAAAFRVDPDLRPADLIDRPERGVEVGDPRFPSVAVAPRERRVSKRRLACESRLGGKSPGKSGAKRAAKRAAKSAATSVARPGK